MDGFNAPEHEKTKSDIDDSFEGKALKWHLCGHFTILACSDGFAILCRKAGGPQGSTAACDNFNNYYARHCLDTIYEHNLENVWAHDIFSKQKVNPMITSFIDDIAIKTICDSPH